MCHGADARVRGRRIARDQCPGGGGDGHLCSCGCDDVESFEEAAKDPTLRRLKRAGGLRLKPSLSANPQRLRGRAAMPSAFYGSLDMWQGRMVGCPALGLQFLAPPRTVAPGAR